MSTQFTITKEREARVIDLIQRSRRADLAHWDNADPHARLRYVVLCLVCDDNGMVQCSRLAEAMHTTAVLQRALELIAAVHVAAEDTTRNG